jgi:hypothetical protein
VGQVFAPSPSNHTFASDFWSTITDSRPQTLLVRPEALGWHFGPRASSILAEAEEAGAPRSRSHISMTVSTSPTADHQDFEFLRVFRCTWLRPYVIRCSFANT